MIAQMQKETTSASYHNNCTNYDKTFM